jgi:hypothetical protein
MVVLIEFIPCRPFSGDWFLNGFGRAQLRTCHSISEVKRISKRETGLPTDKRNLWPRIKPADQDVEGPEGSIG